jgi:sulfate transport system ATP-binding protein
LAELQERTHTTTLLVTHDQEEAFELSQQIVLLTAGRVAQIGSPEELYDRPATPFVASFIGAANVLRGRVQEGRAHLGPLAVEVPTEAPEGTPIQAVVRPHEVRVEKAPRGADLGFARVERLTRLGAQVKLSLALPSGDAMLVQLPKLEVDELGIEHGDSVTVDLRRAKLFVEDRAV